MEGSLPQAGAERDVPCRDGAARHRDGTRRPGWGRRRRPAARRRHRVLVRPGPGTGAGRAGLVGPPPRRAALAGRARPAARRPGLRRPRPAPRRRRPGAARPGLPRRRLLAVRDGALAAPHRPRPARRRHPHQRRLLRPGRRPPRARCCCGCTCARAGRSRWSGTAAAATSPRPSRHATPTRCARWCRSAPASTSRSTSRCRPRPPSPGARRAAPGRPDDGERGCLTTTCDCPFVRDYTAPWPEHVPLTSVWSKGDGVVRWRSCVVPYARSVEVPGSHVGLAFNRHAYRAVADALAPAAGRSRTPGSAPPAEHLAGRCGRSAAPRRQPAVQRLDAGGQRPGAGRARPARAVQEAASRSNDSCGCSSR